MLEAYLHHKQGPRGHQLYSDCHGSLTAGYVKPNCYMPVTNSPYAALRLRRGNEHSRVRAEVRLRRRPTVPPILAGCTALYDRG
jgi:hypothetical protein